MNHVSVLCTAVGITGLLSIVLRGPSTESLVSPHTKIPTTTEEISIATSPVISGAVYMRHTFIELERIGDWNAVKVGDATVYRPALTACTVHLLSVDDGKDLELSIPIGACYVVHDDKLIVDYVGYTDGEVSRPEYSTSTDCWPASNLRSYTYTGGCWGQTTYDMNTLCWTKRCTQDDGCTLTVYFTPGAGGGETETSGACDASPLNQTTLCSGQLCFEHD